MSPPVTSCCYSGSTSAPLGSVAVEGFVLYANVQKVLNVRVRCCVCVCVGGGGGMYLLLVRGVSRSKTLIPLILVTIRLDAFYYNNK